MTDYDDLRAKALILQSRDLEIAEFHAMQLPLAAGLLALLDEIEQLRADAERYRWVRANIDACDYRKRGEEKWELWTPDLPIRGEQSIVLDAAIDRARGRTT